MAGALAGMRVIEMAGMGPVPFCGMLMADMGAEVLRIDRVARVETGVGLDDRTDLRGRGKRSARIDLRHPLGLASLLKLIAGADVLLEGYRPGVAERMGFGPEVCQKLNPRLVYGRATGWGQTGPLAQAAGHDINYLALTGALDMIGMDGGPPVPPLNLVGDYGGGALYLAFGVVCALVEVKNSGRGQVVDAAMIDGVTSLMTVYHGMMQAGQGLAPRGQNVLDGGAPYYTTYQTLDGLWMAVGAIEARFYSELLAGLKLNPADLPAQNDRARWPALRAAIAGRFARRTRAEWEAVFAGHDACVSPVLGLAEVEDHPHNKARDLLVQVGDQTHPAPAPRLEGTPGTIRRGPVLAGQDTAAALRDWGLPEAEIATGFAQGFFAGLDPATQGEM